MQQNVDIVSLSVGSREQQDAEVLHPVVVELNKKGTIVVAAANNQNSVTYPASFKEVMDHDKNRVFKNSGLGVLIAS